MHHCLGLIQSPGKSIPDLHFWPVLQHILETLSSGAHIMNEARSCVSMLET